MTADKRNFIREDLLAFAEDCAANGVRLMEVKFRYNIHGRCTDVLLDCKEEGESEDIEPLRHNEL